MATDWVDFYAKCPYYLRSDRGKKQLSCQGVADSSSLCWKFGKREDMMIQIRTFCCDKYARCEVYRLLRQIYEEDDL